MMNGFFCCSGFAFRRLRKLVRGRTGFLYAEHVSAKGKDLYQVICREDPEGIVAKHRLAPYSTKPQSWFKVLNPDYSQKRGRKEMFNKFRERRVPVATAFKNDGGLVQTRTADLLRVKQAL
jgi:hypothetical protein